MATTMRIIYKSKLVYDKLETIQILEIKDSVFMSRLIKQRAFFESPGPGDFATKVKEINSQSDLIWMSRFAGPSYLTVRSFVYIILIWDPYIFNL